MSNHKASALDERLDRIGDRLRAKEIRIPTEFVAAVLFLAFAVAMLVLMPSQVPVMKGDVVSGQRFPTLIMALIILCGGSLLLKQVFRLIRHEPLETKTLNLLTEVKALLILLIMAGFYLINELTGLFVLGACFCVLGFLLFFRCKKPSYYIITLAFAVGIWASFRFGLNVRF